LRRRVALKVLPFAGALDERQLQRFQNEAQAAAQLHHSNIVPVFYVGCERGVLFYAMQYIEGHTLAALVGQMRGLAGLEEGGALTRRVASGHWLVPRPVSPTSPGGGVGPAPVEITEAANQPTRRSAVGPAYFRTAAQLVRQAAEALEHAHQTGVVHRDVKPANLMVDVRGHLWVTDFGLAQVRGTAGLTRTGDVVGTLRYASPEQLQPGNEPVDHRTDFYSLGVTLYELLALRPAFEGDDRADLLQRIIHEEPSPPRRLNRAVPGELEKVVLRAIAEAPAERYATAGELVDDLGRFLKDEPVRARRPTLLQRPRKYVRRNRGPVLAALAIIFLLVAGIVGTTWGLVRAVDERDKKDKALGVAQENEAKALAAARAESIERKRAELVDGLLESVFVNLGPQTNEGDLKRDLLERLDELANALEKEYANEPGVRIKLWHVMGTLRRSLGENHKALALYERAWKESAKHLAPDNPLVLTLQGNLRLASLNDGEPAKAVQLLEQTLEKAKTTFGPDEPRTVAVMNNLASAYLAVGELKKGVQLYDEVLKLVEAGHGPPHLDVLRSRNNLGAAYFLAGRSDKAVPLLKQVLEQRTAKLGPNDLATLTSLHNLGSALSNVDELGEAVKMLEQAVKKRTNLLPADHPDTLSSLNNLGNAYRRAGELGKAVPMLELALKKRKAKLPADHPDTLESMHTLALAYWYANRLD
jgi:eukaryotic-like serine/threonine-protein kinase